MKALSVILGVMLVCSLYTGYRQLMSSACYSFARRAEKTGQWGDAVVFAIKAYQFNPLDDRTLHPASRALIELGHVEPAIALIAKCLKVRPNKDYLLYNLRVAIQLRHSK